MKYKITTIEPFQNFEKNPKGDEYLLVYYYDEQNLFNVIGIPKSEWTPGNTDLIIDKYRNK